MEDDMKDFTTEPALLGLSWDEALESATQGTASLHGNRLMAEVAFGQILSDGDRVPEDEGLPAEADHLYGFTRDGWYIAVARPRSFSVQWHCPGGTRQAINGTSLLRSRREFDPDGMVDAAELQVAGFSQWLQDAPLQGESRYVDDRLKETLIRIDWQPDAGEPLFEDDVYRVAVSHELSRRGDFLDGVTVKHTGLLILSFKDPVSVSQAVHTSVSLLECVSFFMGSAAELEKLSMQIQGAESAVEYYAPLVFRGDEKVPSSWQMPFLRRRLTDDEAARMIGAWLEADDQLSLCLRICAQSLLGGRGGYLDAMFLAAARLMEALASYTSASALSMPQAQYKRRRRTALGCLRDAGHDELACWLEKVFPGNRKGQNRMLEELLERYPLLSDFIIGDRASFCALHCAARNQYTHLNATVSIGGERLFWHTERVLLFCYGVCAVCLGLEEARVVELLKESHYADFKLSRMREVLGE